MATLDLNILRSELIREIQQTDDLQFLAQLKALYKQFRHRNTLDRMTWEELYERLDRAESDAVAGRVTSQEDLEKEIENW